MATIHRLLKKPFFGRFQKPWRWPDGVSPDDWQRIRFSSGSGAILAGVFGSATSNPARGAVVFAHPMGLPAKGFWLKQRLPAALREHGFHVLAFDFNGFGESETGSFDYPADVLAAGQYMRTHYPDLPLAAIGASFGAGYAVCAMARDGSVFRGAVLEAVFPTLPYYWRRYPLPYTVLRVSQVIYPWLERSLRPIEAAAKLQNRPHVLLIFGEKDTVTPPSIGVEFERTLRNGAGVELWLVPGADHIQAYAAAAEEYRRRVFTFLDKIENEGRTR